MTSLSARLDRLARACSSVDVIQARRDRIDEIFRVTPPEAILTADFIELANAYQSVVDLDREDAVLKANEWLRMDLGVPAHLSSSDYSVVLPIVVAGPDDPKGQAYYEARVNRARCPFEPSRQTLHDPRAWNAERSRWLLANRDLIMLGSDRGAALHEKAAPLFAQARAEHAAIRDPITRKVEEGTARRSDFRWLYGRDHHDTAVVTTEAAARRRARLRGQAFYEHHGARSDAAIIGSYGRKGKPPAEIVEELESAADRCAARGQLGHQAWVEANRWLLALERCVPSRIEFEASQSPDHRSQTGCCSGQTRTSVDIERDCRGTDDHGSQDRRRP